MKITQRYGVRWSTVSVVVAALTAALAVPAQAAPPVPSTATVVPTVTEGLPIVRAVPSAPRRASAEALDRAARVRWRQPASNGGFAIVGYRVQQLVSGTWVTQRIVGATSRSTTISGLTNGDTYRFRVLAVNLSGLSSPSGEVRLTLPTVVDVRGGFFHTCAVKAQNRQVRCWGNGVNGQLGNGNGTNSLTPVTVSGVSGVRALAVGEKQNCVIVTGRVLKCWGGNDFGQIGDGSTDDRLSPVQVALTDVIGVSAGQTHTCALRANRDVWCWGNNNAGQAGVDPNVDAQVLTPTRVVGLHNLRSLALGHFFSCALLMNRTVKCWGQNGSNQLGDGTTDDRHTPAAVTGLTDVRSLAAGQSSACAQKLSRRVFCWGDNSDGQIGDGTTTARPAPTRVIQLTEATSLTVGRNHACVRRSASVRCWGDSDNGEIGDGSTTDRPTRVTVPLSGAAEIVRTGNDHTCAVLRDTRVFCWGLNNDGQTGKGSTSMFESSPVRVLGI